MNVLQSFEVLKDCYVLVEKEIEAFIKKYDLDCTTVGLENMYSYMNYLFLKGKKKGKFNTWKEFCYYVNAGETSVKDMKNGRNTEVLTLLRLSIGYGIKYHEAIVLFYLSGHNLFSDNCVCKEAHQTLLKLQDKKFIELNPEERLGNCKNPFSREKTLYKE